MRTRALLSAMGLAVVAGGGLALSGIVGCPLSHDALETDRPCWDAHDCVENEQCQKPDGGSLGQGRCALPTDGPCFPDAGLGYYCFAGAAGEPSHCFYDPQSRCTECDGVDEVPDGGCPDASCIAWQAEWGCR